MLHGCSPANQRVHAALAGSAGARRFIRKAVFFLAVIACSTVELARAYEMPQTVIAGGGGSSSNGPVLVTGTIGQNVTAVSTGGPYSVGSGFWGLGSGPPPVLTLDIDLNGKGDALTDGLLILRYMFGLTGTLLISGAIGSGAMLTTAPEITQRLVDVTPILDADGNGKVDALTDGLLFIRYMFGLRGSSLVAGAIGPGAMRSTAPAVELYIQSLYP